jgi:hypothetical protein
VRTTHVIQGNYQKILFILYMKIVRKNEMLFTLYRKTLRLNQWQKVLTNTVAKFWSKYYESSFKDYFPEITVGAKDY